MGHKEGTGKQSTTTGKSATSLWTSEEEGSMRLPPGAWCFLGNVSAECAAEELQAFLLAAEIDIGLERISMHNRDGHRASALISLPPDQVAKLVERAINQRPLQGRVLRISSPGLKQ
ncbi:MAG TPA: hypothetical protein VN025_05930 [Candidatus Dormibacteraeota bacterium]|nr:hypothetical protein [Candidatus Dormibacteraeota bacterium]